VVTNRSKYGGAFFLGKMIMAMSMAFTVGIEGLHPVAVRVGADAVKERDEPRNDGRTDHAQHRNVHDEEGASAPARGG
jgi:hypothetical protein